MATNVLDKVGSIGAVIAGAAVPCCFPFLSLIGSILGLSFLAPYERYILYAMQILVIVALVGSVIAFRNHRKIIPLLLGILSTVAVLYSLNTNMDVRSLYGGLAGLLVVAVWNSIEARRCADKCVK
ncbi:MAG: Mercuric resistance protein MerC [Acidobacteria bacterium OLB17]|nr:MAG: Mercuric resistance protein MerC [Acidobacteria bacterium OLB17]MCZ2391616.1 MerC family mercury resistance protein [Acidobacteriota bacterium]